MQEQVSIWFSLPQLLWLPFYLGAFVYIRRQPHDGSHAQAIATMAVAIMAGSLICGFIIHWTAVQYLGTAEFLNFELIFKAASNLLSMLATGMLFFAVFAGRNHKSVTHSIPMSSSRSDRSLSDSNNPYSPPSN